MNSSKVNRVSRVSLKFSAQSQDVIVNGAARWIVVIAPRLIQQFAARKHSIRIQEKAFQCFEFLGSQDDWRARRSAHLHLGEINADIFEPDNFHLRQETGVANNLGDQLFPAKGQQQGPRRGRKCSHPRSPDKVPLAPGDKCHLVVIGLQHFAENRETQIEVLAHRKAAFVRNCCGAPNPGTFFKFYDRYPPPLWRPGQMMNMRWTLINHGHSRDSYRLNFSSQSPQAFDAVNPRCFPPSSWIAGV